MPDEAAIVVFDEVHYMGDPERGTAWEESILLSRASSWSASRRRSRTWTRWRTGSARRTAT